MKQKITFCCLLLLFTITTNGCFSITEWLLGCEEVTVTPVVRATVVQTITVRPSLLVNWQYHWWRDTGGQCWWLDYNVNPVYWPRPKLIPRVIFERRIMIPRDTKAGIDRYVDHGVPTGSFLRAVLSNDLFEAIAKADFHNKLALVAICDYIYNFTPTTCHGSPEVVTAWLSFHTEKPKEAHEAASGDRDSRAAYYAIQQIGG